MKLSPRVLVIKLAPNLPLLLKFPQCWALAGTNKDFPFDFSVSIVLKKKAGQRFANSWSFWDLKLNHSNLSGKELCYTDCTNYICKMHASVIHHQIKINMDYLDAILSYFEQLTEILVHLWHIQQAEAGRRSNCLIFHLWMSVCIGEVLFKQQVNGKLTS